MAKLDGYSEIIQDILLDYTYEYDGGELYPIFDEKRNRYQIMNVGWHGSLRREYGTILHMDICNGKIWVQWNGTEDDVAAELVKRGVPKSDIVLGMHAPYKRQLTEYAVG